MPVLKPDEVADAFAEVGADADKVETLVLMLARFLQSNCTPTEALAVSMNVLGIIAAGCSTTEEDMGLLADEIRRDILPTMQVMRERMTPNADTIGPTQGSA